jgi:alpha-1,2-mannosyltransferase
MREMLALFFVLCRAMKCLQSIDSTALDSIALLIIGSTRNRDDEALFRALEGEVVSSKLQHHVFLVRNGSHSDVQLYMRMATIGLHTMWNEHFGISIVEMLASGLVVIAHNSGG